MPATFRRFQAISVRYKTYRTVQKLKYVNYLPSYSQRHFKLQSHGNRKFSRGKCELVVFLPSPEINLPPENHPKHRGFSEPSFRYGWPRTDPNLGSAQAEPFIQHV